MRAVVVFAICFIVLVEVVTSTPTRNRRDSEDDPDISVDELFRTLDKDGNKLLNLAELEDFQDEDMPPKDFLEMFDTNTDGMLDFDEFERGLQTLENEEDDDFDDDEDFDNNENNENQTPPKNLQQREFYENEEGDIDENDDNDMNSQRYAYQREIEEEELTLKEVFNRLDGNRDTFLDIAELRKLPEVFPDEHQEHGSLTPEVILERFDTDKDGLINFEEFEIGVDNLDNEDEDEDYGNNNQRRPSLYAREKGGPKENFALTIGATFKKLDQDGDKTLNLAEFQKLPELFKDLDENPIDIFGMFDINKDQIVNFQEFKEGVKQLKENNPGNDDKPDDERLFM